jgi:hypothetical protein
VSYEDPLFPLPAPDWILTYTVLLRRVSQLVDDTNDEGFPTTTGAPVVSIKAYLGSPDTRKLDRGGESADVVVLVRNDTAVSHRDQIEVTPSSGLPTQLQGLFRIESVRPNPSHTRLLCNRITDPEGSVR